MADMKQYFKEVLFRQVSHMPAVFLLFIVIISLSSDGACLIIFVGNTIS